MTDDEARNFLSRCGVAAARKRAESLDAEVRMWLRCGYYIDELQILHFQNPSEPSEIVPKSFERLGD